MIKEYTNEEKRIMIGTALEKLYNGEFNVSFSFLTRFLDSPRLAVYYKAGLIKETEAMEMGKLFHCMFLEPDKFDEKYCLVPRGTMQPSSANQKRFCELRVEGLTFDQAVEESYSNKPNKSQVSTLKSFDEFIEILCEKGERILVEQHEVDHYKFMIEQALYDPRFVHPMNTEGECEKEIYWNFYGFQHRGILDKKANNFIWDMKKMARGVGPDKVRVTLYKMYLPLQAVMYLFGIKMFEYIFQWLCFDDDANCNIVTLSENDKYEYFRFYEKVLKRLQVALLEERMMEGTNFWSNSYDGSFYFEKPNYIVL